MSQRTEQVEESEKEKSVLVRKYLFLLIEESFRTLFVKSSMLSPYHILVQYRYPVLTHSLPPLSVFHFDR